MTQQLEIAHDPKYKTMHNEGFVGIVDSMGSDEMIERAARVSYQKGTRKVTETRGLIRYLMRHKHTSPFEMGEILFHCKMPIFVARQWIRHRTANVNEMSARYSQLPNEFYMPSFEYIQPQSTKNKQGREQGEVTDTTKKGIQWLLQAANENAYEIYQTLLMEKDESGNLLSNAYDMVGASEEFPEDFVDENFEGLTRELARMVLPTSIYTEWYWKIDLHNLFHFLQLRMDPHAQQEIRDFANEMYNLIEPMFPLACEAFRDYKLNSKTLSSMDQLFIQDALKREISDDPNTYGMSQREYNEILDWTTGLIHS